jgi:hypothetical protein
LDSARALATAAGGKIPINNDLCVKDAMTILLDCKSRLSDGAESLKLPERRWEIVGRHTHWHEKQRDSRNDREPDQPHGHLG